LTDSYRFVSVQDPELGTRLCRRGRAVSWSTPWLTQQRRGRGGRPGSVQPCTARKWIHGSTYVLVTYWLLVMPGRPAPPRLRPTTLCSLFYIHMGPSSASELLKLQPNGAVQIYYYLSLLVRQDALFQHVSARRSTRDLPCCGATIDDRAFQAAAASVWNSLPSQEYRRRPASLPVFRSIDCKTLLGLTRAHSD